MVQWAWKRLPMAVVKFALWVPERAEIIFIQHNPAVNEEMPDDHPLLVMSTRILPNAPASSWDSP